MERCLKDVIAISWENHRRTSGICRYLGIELHVLLSDAKGVGRYAQLIPRTFSLLRARRFHTVIVQNPSLVLTLVAVLLRPWFSLRIIMDAHNEAVEPYLNPAVPIRWITHWLLGRADRVIVTNRFLAEIVARHGGHPIVLADRIPEAPAEHGSANRPGEFNIVVISTFARDEPIEEVLAAARQLGPDYHYIVTGDYNRLPVHIRADAPANVTFTGFLSEADYWASLRASDLVVDLSLIDNCLVCGAYEALAVGVPMVLSANRACIELFDQAAGYSNNDASSIAESIRSARGRAGELRAAAALAKTRLTTLWEQQVESLTAAIRELAQ